MQWHATYQREKPPRRTHCEGGQTTTPQLHVHRLPHPAKNFLVREGRDRQPDARDRIVRPHLEQAPPPSHQRQHPPGMEGGHDHNRSKVTVPQPLQPL